MVEPFSLGALGAIALTDGIKFLYAEAGEILRRRRERKNTADTEVVNATLALRETIEAIVGQRITFRGEQREPTGTTIAGSIRARELHGRASGVDFEGTPTGDLRGEVITDTAGAGADVAGVRVSVNR
jgi:hypothetical protein